MHSNYWTLALRRFLLSITRPSNTHVACACCHIVPVERNEYVCDAEPCQHWALSGQAMMAATPVRPSTPGASPALMPFATCHNPLPSA